jgi:putative DNA primase/helicase
MKEQIGDESIFLRINELKNGLIQFTDSTNALQLVKGHGRDINMIGWYQFFGIFPAG